MPDRRRSRPVAVVLAGTPWTGVKGTDRHIAEALSSSIDVVWVDPPRSSIRGGGEGWGATQETPRLRRLSVAVPPGASRPVIRSIADRLLRRAVRRELRATGAAADIVISMNLTDCSGWVPGARSVVYLTDDLPAGSDYLGLSRRSVASAERRAILGADVVVCVSDVIAARIAGLGRTAHVIPNGCDVDIFERQDPAPIDLGLPGGGVVVLAGNLNQRIDWDAVDAVAVAGINLLLVGPVRSGVDRSRFDALCSRPNVRWVGQVAHQALPAYLAAVDVGITPYVDNDFNRASFPLKTLEYLAAGLGAVSSDLPAVRWLDTDLIRVASTPGSFVAAVRAALDEGAAPELVSQRRAFAAGHSWGRRADDLLAAAGVTLMSSFTGVGR